jgi:hypothetical protein
MHGKHFSTTCQVISLSATEWLAQSTGHPTVDISMVQYHYADNGDFIGA